MAAKLKKRALAEYQSQAEMTILYWPKNIDPIFPKKDPQKIVLQDTNNPNFLIKTLFLLFFGTQRPPNSPKNLPQFQNLNAIFDCI